nr:hypothetical protein [Stanieria cyanosphaera]
MTVTEIAVAQGRIEVTGEGLAAQGEFNLEGNRIEPDSQETLKALLEVAVLCNNAVLPHEQDRQENKVIGDPMEVALLVAGAKAGINHQEILHQQPEVKEEAFDSD